MLGAPFGIGKRCAGVNRVRKRGLNLDQRIDSAMFSSRIFRSRWAALLWAGGILWTAYDIADATPGREPGGNQVAPAVEDATGVAVDNADLAILANAISG